ncbi:hypothetical protein CBI38_28805 [Rhodococcus oxybenzonivorans]|uniref:Uncharacterized protein n=1 Tax=Rhodococcus oxybenzonivorans TaxID=1990687 RepID=A0A2S2C2E8_9NOCA|nr:hypothetical protein CBI38_28805 [Rhodococcus oxybenzonivorans]
MRACSVSTTTRGPVSAASSIAKASVSVVRRPDVDSSIVSRSRGRSRTKRSPEPAGPTVQIREIVASHAGVPSSSSSDLVSIHRQLRSARLSSNVT